MLRLRERGMRGVCLCFLLACVAEESLWPVDVRDNDLGFGPEGARALSEPLGQLTALQLLHLEGKIFLFLFT